MLDVAVDPQEQIDSLLAHLAQDSTELDVAAAELVPGDVVLLAEGDRLAVHRRRGRGGRLRNCNGHAACFPVIVWGRASSGTGTDADTAT